MPFYLQLSLLLGFAFLNGALAMCEFAVVSSRLGHLQSLKTNNKKGASEALDLATDPGRFLSTLQLGMTTAGVLSGAFSGATIGVNLSGWLSNLGLSTPVAHFIGVGLVVTLTTYLTVIIGELVPKRIALKNPESIACFMAPLMTQLSITARPLVSLLERSSDAILSFLGLASENRSPISEDEIKSLAQEAESAGVIKPGESAIISHVLELGDKSVQNLMTPREKVTMLPLAMPLQEARAIMDQSPFRCFPVYHEEKNKVVGLIWAKDFVNINPNDDLPLQSLIREAVILEAHLDTLEVVKKLQKSPMHMGMVHNDLGEFIGIITAADVLEVLVGAFERAPIRT